MTIYAKVLMFLYGADLLWTVIAIWCYGAQETHPLLQWCYASYGIIGLINAKIMLNGLVIFSLEFGKSISPKEGWKVDLAYVMLVFVYLYSYIASSLLMHRELVINLMVGGVVMCSLTLIIYIIFVLFSVLYLLIR